MTTDSPVLEAEDTTPPADPTIEAAEAQAAADRDLLAKLQARDAGKPAAPRAVTIAELYEQQCALVAAATGKTYRGGVPRLSEQTAVKVLELTLGWALNHRQQQPSYPMLPEEGEPGEGPFGPETVDEVIEASPDQSEG